MPDPSEGDLSGQWSRIPVGPSPDTTYPLHNHPQLCFIKNVVDHPNVEIGDYTYYDDPVEPERFYEKCVRYHFPFVGDKLIIGRFCAFATGLQFIMNGANHMTSGFSTYPFAAFAFGEDGRPGADWAQPELHWDAGFRGDTVVGNDVWIGREALIMPGVTIGDGAIIGTRAVVAKDVPPYAIVVGNPGKIVRARYDQTTIDRLLAIAWWHWPAEKITKYRDLISGADLDALERAAAE